MESEKEVFLKMLMNPDDDLKLLVKMELTHTARDNLKSQKYRKEGNVLFQKNSHSSKEHKEIHSLYNFSIALADEGSEEQAVGFGNRSAFLLHIEKYKDCIIDIDRAVKITKSDVLKAKLLCRKVKCLKIMNNPRVTDILNQIELLLNEIPEDDKDKKKLRELIEETKYFKSNKIICEDKEDEIMKLLDKKEDISQSVEVNYNEKYGRHLVAKRDFKPGEIIFVERMYVSCLSLTKRKTNCYHCFTTCWSGIPCDNCSWAMFCTEDCKKEAMEKYHDMECSIIPCLYCFGSDFVSELHVPLRMLCMGLKKAGSIAKLRNDLETLDENYKDFFMNEKVEYDFTSMCKLQSKIKIDNEEAYATIALAMIKILANNTSFFETKKFDEFKDLVHNEDIVFMGSLLLKLMKIKGVNAHLISNTCEGKDDPNSKYGTGRGMALVSSLVNHRCVSNANHCFTKDRRIITFAVLPIKKNSQIFDTYLGDASKFTKEEWQRLLGCRQFKCECLSCTDGLIDDLTKAVEFKHDEKFYARQELGKILNKYRWLQNRDYNQSCDWKDVEELSGAIVKASHYLTESSLIKHSLCILLAQAYRRIYDFEMNIYNSCIKN